MNTNSNRSKARLVAVLLTALALGACAGGSKVRLSDAALSGEPNAMWAEGQQSVTTGEATVSKGEKRLAQGRQQVRDGEAQISKGNQRVLQARDDYQKAVRASGASTTPKAVAAEAKRLRVIGKRWEDAIEQIKDGNKMVDKGNKTIDRGRTEISEGRRLMESGSILMRNSQRSRLGDKLLTMPTEK